MRRPPTTWVTVFDMALACLAILLAAGVGVFLVATVADDPDARSVFISLVLFVPLFGAALIALPFLRHARHGSEPAHRNVARAAMQLLVTAGCSGAAVAIVRLLAAGPMTALVLVSAVAALLAGSSVFLSAWARNGGLPTHVAAVVALAVIWHAARPVLLWGRGGADTVEMVAFAACDLLSLAVIVPIARRALRRGASARELPGAADEETA